MARRASRKVADVFRRFLRRHAELLDDDVRATMANFVQGPPFVLSNAATVADRALPQGALVATDPPAEDVRARLEQLTDYVVTRLRAGELPRFDLPDLHRANALYDARGDVFLGQNVRPLALDRRGGEMFMRMLLTVEVATDNLDKRMFTTKRGLFYQHETSLPDDASQTDSDRALAALANVLRARRKALGFVEARRGWVQGRLVIRDQGQVFDLTKVGAHTAPRFTDDLEIVSSDAERIVIIEKEAIASRLSQVRWWDTARCIMISGGGFPSISTREFVRKLEDALGISSVVLADGDPAGIQMALTYAHGSISTALETPWLASKGLSWIGLWPSDIERHCGIRDHIRLSEGDCDAARRLLEHPSRTHVKDRIREELAILVDRKIKVELDALIHDSRLEKYLQHKLFDTEPIRI